MRRIVAVGACALSSCIVSPNISDRPPPCAPGYHEDPSGTRCLQGAGGDAAMDAGPDRDGHVELDGGLDAMSPPDSFVPDAGPQIDETGCVLHFAMEEASWTGGAQAIDGCGPANNGVVFGGASTVPGGVIGRAAQFDGSGCIQVADAPELRPTEALT